MRSWLWVVLSCALVCGACESDSGGGAAREPVEDAVGPDAGPSGSDAAGQDDVRDVDAPGDPGDASNFEDASDSGLPALWSGFRYGANLGHRNAAWGDDLYAELARNAGARSLRVKLPAAHLKRWGYDIEVADLTSYQALGMREHIGFLIGTETLAESSAPEGSADWQNEFYIPKNLYEPIFLPGGDVNPQNYWASYVWKTVSTYKPWIRVWHVWNEPDWVSDWNISQTWDARAPGAEDLPRFNGSVFDYIRMLRITREVAQKADPNALVATGGIGYPKFLSALMRYTDNPVDGSVTADFPATGCAYIDVLDFHYYPIYSSRNSGGGADGLISLKQDLQAELDAAGCSVLGFNVSESGAPLEAVGSTQAGGAEYARNYLIKAMVLAQAYDIDGLDWFILSNGDAASTQPFDHMGLYADIKDLTEISEAQKTDLGEAYTVLQSVLGQTRFDAQKTAELVLPQGARGYSFQHENGPRWVLWAETEGDSEAATVAVNLAVSGQLNVAGWDGAKTWADATEDALTLTLTGAPTYVITAN